MRSWKGFRQALPVAALVATLVVLVIAGAGFVNSACANGIPMPPLSSIYIRGDGSVEPSEAPIKRAGETYTIMSDLPNCSIQVQRGNILIEGGCFSLSGYGSHWYEGISVSNVTGVKIQNFTIRGFGWGVNLVGSSRNTIVGNKFEGCAYGVYLGSSDDNYVAGNSVSGGYGVSGVGNFNLIVNNNFTSGLSGGGNGMGIYMTGNNNTISKNFIRHEVSINLGLSAQYNTISYNTILDGSSGILLARSSNNLVFGNIIKGKTDARSGGLYISHDSYDNIIYGNQFENNALAVSLGAQVATFVWNNVCDNTFYRNNFINNSQNVWIAPGTPVNFWDNGKEGNYWSNYTGKDVNGDGIGDTPHILNGNNTDNHPLMKPVSMSQTPNSDVKPPIPSQASSPASSPPKSDSSSAPSETPSPSQSPSENPSPSPSPPQSGGKKDSATTAKPEPFPTSLFIVASGVSAVLVSVGFVVYFTKRHR